MNPPVRKLIPVEYAGKTHECIPGPALISAVERRPDGLPMREAVQSLRITDHAWVLYCALLPHDPAATLDGVIEAVMADPVKYERLSIDLCLETLSPEAARLLEEAEGAGEGEGEEPGPLTIAAG